MGAERDANQYQSVGELEQIRDANLPALHFPVGTPTWHHITFPHSVSRFSSQYSFLCLHTHPRTNPDNGRLTIVLSRTLYLCLAGNEPFFLNDVDHQPTNQPNQPKF